MKVGVIIPDRGDRPKFLNNCLRMLASQSLQPACAMVVGWSSIDAVDGVCDITKRYREGYQSMSKLPVDVIALVENDDWYSKDYLKTMCSEWERQNRPDLLGTSYTIYYHIKLKMWFQMNHPYRSSAMSTLIKPSLQFEWCRDDDPFTDAHLWRTLKGVIFKPDHHLCMGIKHGVGLCGGRSHVDRLNRYAHSDPDQEYLKKHIDPESFKFYSEYFL